MRAVRARLGNSFTIGVRLSPEDFGNARGLDADESVQVVPLLPETGAHDVRLANLALIVRGAGI